VKTQIHLITTHTQTGQLPVNNSSTVDIQHNMHKKPRLTVTTQISWLGLRVGSQLALSLHSSAKLGELVLSMIMITAP